METPAAPGDPAAQALRNRIRARFAELYAGRTRIEAQLADLEAATAQDSDPSLLDELPTLPDLLTDAPPRLLAALLEAFDIQALYNKDMHQATIWVTITDTTPQAIADLLTDPRTDHDTGTGPAAGPPPGGPPASQDRFSYLGNDPIRRPSAHDHGFEPGRQRGPGLAGALALDGGAGQQGRRWRHRRKVPGGTRWQSRNRR